MRPVGFALLSVLLFPLALFGQSPAPSKPQGSDALAKAVRGGDESSVRKLLISGFGGDTILSADSSTTALMAASVLGNPVIIGLLARGATNLDARENYLGMGETALMKSLIRGSEEGSLALLSYGADPTLTNAWGWNALHLAVYRGYDKVLERLLERNGLSRRATVDGFTALHLAARYGRRAAVERLLAAGADRSAETTTGFTPADLAARGPSPGLAAILSGQARPSGIPSSLGQSLSGDWSFSTTDEGGRLRLVLERSEGARVPAMRLVVEPSSGGRVVAWRVGTRDLLKPLDPMDGDRAGGIPLLFPTPNDVKMARLVLEEGTVLMRNPDQPRPSTQHGYAVDDLFSWEAPRLEGGEAVLTVRLAHDSGSLRWPAFPRSNTLTVSYRLSAKGLRIEYGITNRDRRSLPAGFGVHPYWSMNAETNLRLTAGHGRLAFFAGGVRSLSGVDQGSDLRPGRLVSQCPAATSFYFDPGAPARLDWLDAPPFALNLSADPGLGYLVLHKPGKGAFCVEHQGNAADAHRILATGRADEAGLFVIPPGGRVNGWVEYRLLAAP